MDDLRLVRCCGLVGFNESWKGQLGHRISYDSNLFASKNMSCYGMNQDQVNGFLCD